MVAARLPGKAIGWKRFQMSSETELTGIQLDLLPAKALKVSLGEYQPEGCIIVPQGWSPEEADLIERLLNPGARFSALRPRIYPVAGGLRFFGDQRGEILVEDLPVGFRYQVSLPNTPTESREITLSADDPKVVELGW